MHALPAAALATEKEAQVVGKRFCRLGRGEQTEGGSRRAHETPRKKKGAGRPSQAGEAEPPSRRRGAQGGEQAFKSLGERVQGGENGRFYHRKCGVRNAEYGLKREEENAKRGLRSADYSLRSGGSSSFIPHSPFRSPQCC